MLQHYIESDNTKKCILVNEKRKCRDSKMFI